MLKNDTSWLNNMYERLCKKCTYQWQAPSETGKCPRCHADEVETLQHRVNALPRV